MKRMNSAEIRTLGERLRSIIGSRLNKLLCQPPRFCFEFFYKGNTYYLIIDVSPSLPVAFLFQNELPIKFTHQNKPLSLFLKAHFIGCLLSDVELNQKLGRTLKLKFNSGEDLSVEFRLFPHGQNIIAAAGDKKISWNKPKELKELLQDDSLILEERSPEQIFSLWQSLQNQKNLASEKNTKSNKSEISEKTNRSLLKIQEEIEKSTIRKFEIQDQIHLLEEQFHQQSHFKEDKKVLTDLYSELKLINKKQDRLNIRIFELKSILNSEHNPLQVENQKKKESKIQLPSGVKRWELSSGAIAVVGRNAKENVELLRKAKPWDIWLHVKDYPGSYGIIRRKKNQKIVEKEIQEVALWVVKMSLKNRLKNLQGIRLDLVCTECRFLQLIRGDKLGRVTYRNERVVTISVPEHT